MVIILEIVVHNQACKCLHPRTSQLCSSILFTRRYFLVKQGFKHVNEWKHKQA